MARARRTFAPRQSARLTQWIGPADQGFVNVSSGGSTLLANTSLEEPVTVMRTRGEIALRAQAVSVDLNIVGAFGMCVVSAEAVVAGITAIPTPFTDADWGGWFVWRSFSRRVEFNDATGVNLDAAWHFEIDSKAMRKITPNDVIVLIAESQGGAFTISTPVRMLIKLS